MEKQNRGIFWLVEDELLTRVYNESATEGIAKSGDNYNHRLLWEYVKPWKCNKPYDYYPRGRVEISNKGKPIIYMNRNIGEEYVPLIMERFGLSEVSKIHYDGSEHYKSHFDR